MKILYVIDHLGGGGAENQFVETLKRVIARGHSVYCFLVEGKGIRHDSLAESDVNIVLCDKPSESRSTLRAVLQLRALIKQFRPDVVHSYLMYSAFISRTALIGMDRPLPLFICTEFSSPLRMLDEVSFSSAKGMLLRWSYRATDCVTTTSSGVRDELTEAGYLPDDRMEVIHEGVDLQRIERGDRRVIRDELGIPSNARVVAVVGALVQRKGHAFLLDAFAGACGQIDDMRLYVVGQGEELDALQSMASSLGIQDKVVFTGYRRDARRFMNAADVFVLPSLYEGMPNVVMESMAIGTPVITTGMYGTLELIDDGISGILTSPGDTLAIEQGLVRLFKDEALRHSIAASAAKKIEQFTFDDTVDRLELLYGRL